MSRRKKRVGDRPDALEKKRTPIHELPPPPSLQVELINAANSYLRLYLMGDCSVIVTREFDEWHMSISNRDRYPTWMEISEAWYRLVPGAKDFTAALILPPLHEYINLNEFCMQVHQISAREGD
jgi:hypothetical protein